MIFLHCWKCRLRSTPSGRRIVAFGGTRTPAETQRICEQVQAMRMAHARGE